MVDTVYHAIWAKVPFCRDIVAATLQAETTNGVLRTAMSGGWLSLWVSAREPDCGASRLVPVLLRPGTCLTVPRLESAKVEPRLECSVSSEGAPLVEV